MTTEEAKLVIRQEAKKWAELFTALAEGKIIARRMIDPVGTKYSWEQVHYITTDEKLENYCILLTPKTRRMTNQELADWLRDCPEEHREWKYKNGDTVFSEYPYNMNYANEEVGDILIRSNHGEWEEPLIKIEE